jgi:DNA-directed RNA polymerase subunit omega
MARITVEDCVQNIPNRFELCLIAGNRAKNILSGAPTTLDKKEKPAVIALREIAYNLIDIEVQKNNIITSIKNKGIINTINDEGLIADAIAEESEPNLELTESSFISENIKIED